MLRAVTTRKFLWAKWTKEDEDVMACQVISAFSWIFLILLVNFFFLHRPDAIPTAEANWVEPQPALRPPEAPQPLPLLASLPDPVPWEVSREFIEDDYKPNYYFLYKDQVRFVDRIPEKKTVLASRKTLVPVPVEPKPEEIVKKELEKPAPKPEPLRLAWVDMSLLQEPEPEKREPRREPPKAPPPKAVQLAMVESLDLNMEMAKDTPMPVVPREASRAPKQAMPKIRASAVDVAMEIIDQPPPEERPRVVAPARPSQQPVVRSASGADYVSLPMEIAPEASRFAATAMPSSQPAQKGTPHRMLIAKGASGPATDVPMSLETGESRQTGSRSGVQGPIKKDTQAARFAAVSGKGVGGIDLGTGLIEAEGHGRGAGGGDPARVASAKAPQPARVTARSSRGSIQLGTPLPFALADVGDETHTGSAYIRNSTQLKRLLEQQALPAEPVTVSTEAARGDPADSSRLVAVSYSRAQVVLQYGNGKQHVISLVKGEPYPRFEMRRSADGVGSVPVGTKLEEITSCLSTLQHVLKE
jgi:hypothetical protein